MPLFDPAFWKNKLREPRWYEAVPPLLAVMEIESRRDRAAAAKLKEEIYSFVEQQLATGEVALGQTGKAWDAARAPIDTIVIHHTSLPPGLTPARLSAIELMRLYAPAYAKNYAGELVYSDHWREGKLVFWPYHWLIRTDGTAERLLLDQEVGWQAGNWDINCRSVAIAIDDDHEVSIPAPAVLSTIAKLIREQYPQVSKERVFGHREINPKTSCPSDLFLSSFDHQGWKEKLLEMI